MKRAVIFDLCDTVVRTAGVQALLELPGLAPGHDEVSLEAWFQGNPLYFAYERGQVGTAAFLASMQQGLCPEARLEELEAAVCALVVESIAGMPELLERLARSAPLYALSNNNPLLWRGTVAVCPALCHFRGVFLSQDTGLLKPEDAAFAYALRRMGRRPDEVLLIDDNPACVAAAVGMGMEALLFEDAAVTERWIGERVG